ncbi:MAG: TonB-dependent receptor [Epsilonproteobacteria bacterium]|nr:TonB-dependent receptor [Campylobacterota bacterium]
MKCPKGFRGKYFSLAAILAVSTTVTLASTTASYSDSQSSVQKQDEYAQSEEETPTLEESSIVIISKKIKVKAIDAPFASEIYTKNQIKKSHAKNLYEFLNTQTSVSLLPNYGNKFAPLIDMRGYGVANGYQNVVITVNGRRINNIDGSPQLLASIPLQSVQKIEIIKGSGSVEYGDGANAGVINIITKDTNGLSFKTYASSHGAKFGSVSMGIKQKKFSINGYIDDYSDNGARLVDALGNRDKSWSRNKYIDISFTPFKNLDFKIGKHVSKNGVIYAKGMTYTQYLGDINSVNTGSSSGYFDSDNFLTGFDYRFNTNFKFNFDYSHEKKTSTIFRVQKYDYKSYDTKIQYDKNNFKTLFGVQKFNGNRKITGQDTTKDNLGYYAKAVYQVFKSRFSLGARVQRVNYAHNDISSNLKSDASLNAFDIGYNYKIDNISSVFINYNKSFQAPNIDMFFKPVYVGWTYDHTEFNGFIKPMKVKTLNIGFNYLGYPNKTKLTLFYSWISDEIYYDSASYTNTNLDKTRKYGLELYDRYNILYNLYTTLNYSYIDTSIIKNQSNPSIVGDGIPGVSKHNLKLALGYNPTHRVSFKLSHTYKSRAYAMSDFDQTLGKQDSYNSTDLSASYKYKKFEFFAKISNLFDRKNALFVDGWSGLSVYPVNYERSFMLGVNAKF